MRSIRGNVWKYGDDVNTDVIFPGKYTYTISDPEEMARHALEDLDPDFVGRVQPGDIIVAGKNFGCGSSREQAATCLKYAGVGAIIAVSFARIFYRNAINQGLPALSVPEAAGALKDDRPIDRPPGRQGKKRLRVLPAGLSLDRPSLVDRSGRLRGADRING